MIDRLINVKGLAELGAALDQFPAKFEKNVMRGALRAGMVLVRDVARANVPVAPPSGEGAKVYHDYMGALRDSIHVSARRAPPGEVRVSVVAGGKVKGADVFYAAFVERGTAAHDITAANRKGLSVGGLFFQSVHHPGAKPHPYLLPALDTTADAALAAVADYIRRRLEREGALDEAST